MSKLTRALNIASKDELYILTVNIKPELQAIAEDIIINGKTYVEAGKPYKKSKQAIYELMKRLYLKKYGKEYDTNRKNT